MLFQKGKLKVRQLELKDNILLAKWLSNPIVLKYYEGRDNPFNVEKVNMEFYQPQTKDLHFKPKQCEASEG
ncbi:hypothetical protein ACSVDA_21865 [Cytobacillus sp. Hm23]